MVLPRKVVVAAVIYAARCCTQASPSNTVPSSALCTPTAPAFVADSGSSAEGGVSAGVPLSSPTIGQISFRTKTRNGVRGLLPKPRLRLWGEKGQDEGLDNVKRFLHVTADALVLEVEGEDECLSVARGPESLGGARVTVVTRKDAGIDPDLAEATGSSSVARKASTKITVDGLFGIYNLLSGPFVAVISRSKLRYANHDLGVEFRQVSKVQLIPVLAAPRGLDEGQAREEARLLALLALAFRSHQFYFSHAHDVTQTLQSLRVSSSSSSSSSSSLRRPSAAAAAAATTTGSKRASSGASSNAGAQNEKPKVLPASKANKNSTSSRTRRRQHRSTMGGTAAVTAAPKPPPPDTRFFWNIGVLGPLLDLREGLEMARDGGGEETRNRVKNGGESTTAMEAAAAAAVSGVGREAAAAAVDRWLTPVMSGFLQVERGCRAGERAFDVMFVSRRSRLRQGARYTRRGIDDRGNVANFVETEQSLLHEDKSVTSHVQIRGSIPVLWSSPTNLRYHPKVRIDPDQDASLRALRRHSEDLMQLYGKKGGGIVFVNLVDKKNEQGALGEAFDAALKAVQEGAGAEDVPDEAGDAPSSLAKEAGGHSGTSIARAAAAAAEEMVGRHATAGVELAGSLRHVWFDFHHECRNMHWENLDKLLAIVDHEFGEQGFYHAGPGGETLSVQDGVVRTNCMDCLDRTNVVQSLLARRSMLVQLRAVGVDIPEPEGADGAALALTLDMLEMPAEELERRFRDLWGNNADEISMLYAGTPALKGDFTRTGQRTKMGLLQDGTNSAIRYVVNNFQDHRRQESVDLLLGVNRPFVDEDGNILGDFFQEPLDLDLWATRPAQLRQLQQGQRPKGGREGPSAGVQATATGARGGATSDIRDALASLPGSAPTNKTGRKVTAQKMKTAGATGVLALQEHGLKEVPEGLFLLVKLRALNMSSNSLKLLPSAINTLTKLKTLRLDGNRLEAIPDLSALSSLADVSAGGNRLTGAGALGALPASLTKLVLRENKLGEVPLAVLGGLPALQVLDLSANSIEGLPPLAAVLPALVELILDQNSLRALGDELVGLSKLKKLSARSNHIAAVDPFSGQQAISQGLFADSSVESLELAGNIMDKTDLMRMEGVAAFLARREKNKNKNLQGGGMLTLSVCGLD
eukprot:g17093.t1